MLHPEMGALDALVEVGGHGLVGGALEPGGAALDVRPVAPRLLCMNRWNIGLVLGAALAVTACSKRTAPPAGGAGGVSAEAQTEAANLIATRCTPCHGPNGRGDGPASAGLNPKPRNWTDKAWQKVTPDEEIEKAILYGGSAVGKSPAMPPNPDLQSKPEVVKALRMRVRQFGQ